MASCKSELRPFRVLKDVTPVLNTIFGATAKPKDTNGKPMKIQQYVRIKYPDGTIYASKIYNALYEVFRWNVIPPCHNVMETAECFENVLLKYAKKDLHSLLPFMSKKTQI